MMKRFFSICMALLMLLSLLPTTVLATEEGEIPMETQQLQDHPTNAVDETPDGDEPPAPVHASLVIQLVGGDGEALQGGAFALKNSADEVLGEWTTDAEGKFALDYFVNGTYILSQTAAPTHFVLNSNTYEVIVADDGATISVKAVGSEEAAVVATADKVGAYTVTNTRQTGALQLTVAYTFLKEGVAVEAPDWIENVAEAEYEVTVTVDKAVGAALNGTFGGATFTDNAATLLLKAGDTAEITDLPCGFAYTVAVNTADAAFVSAITNGDSTVAAESTAVAITNTYAYETYNKGFAALWVDATDDEIFPEGELTVYKDEDCEEALAVLTPDEDGKLFWEVKEAGTYYLKETKTPAGYHSNTAVVELTAAYKTVVVKGVTQNRLVLTAKDLDSEVTEQDVDKAYADRLFIVESTPIQPVTVSVNVKWTVPDGYTDLPASVDVQLYRDGAVYGDPVTLNKDNDWKHSWSGSGITDAYTWEVKQVTTPEGYSASVTNSGAYSRTIVNKLSYGNVNVSASVSWLNPKNYTKQPTSAKLTLYRDGKVYQTVTVNESTNWVHRWYSLPDCFEWTVDEVVVPTNYKKKITHVGNAWVIVNAHQEIPLTGDDNPVWLWAGATGVAAVGLGISLYLLLKKRKTEE